MNHKIRKFLDQLTHGFKLDSSRIVSHGDPFCWYVKSTDCTELLTWAAGLGLLDSIEERIMEQDFGTAPVYTATPVSMRPIDSDYWIMVIVGFWSDDKENGYRGLLAVSKDGQEESLAKRWMEETQAALAEDIELWSLKHNRPLELNLLDTGDNFKPHWFPGLNC